MKYALVVISLLVNFTYAQCDYSNESQCSSNSNCEWVEDVSYGNCEDIINNFDCGEIEECSWWSGCHGGTYQINNSYCQEIEVLECSNMNKLQCIQDSSCSWNEDIEIGNCSQFDNSENSCTSYPGECFWDEDITYTSCDYPNSGMCNSEPGCYWDCNYGYCDCYGSQQSIETECIGQYEFDNGSCEETEELECSTMDELQCDQDSSCSWVNDLDSGNCWDYNNSNSCNSNDNCNWTSYQQACTGTGYTDCISQNPACSYSWLEYTCTGSYTVSYCGGGSYEIDNGYCEESTPTVFLTIADVDIANGIIYIDITNNEDVSGFQFLLSDSPNNISIAGAGGGVAEEAGFSISSNEEGVVVAFSFTGDVIPSGSHTLLEYYFDIDNQDLTTLCIEDIVFSDPNGLAMTAVSSDCFETSLEDFYLGDANGDGVLNVLDIVMIVNIILNSEYDLSSDYNQDGVLNVLDVVGIMNEIMEN